MRPFTAIVPGLIVLAAAAFTLAAGPMALKQIQLAQISTSVAVATANLDRGNILDQINAEVRSIHDAVMPGVVHIDVRFSSGDDEDEGRSRRFRSSNGSGWFFDNQGHIVTNAHVVQGASSVNVQFHDGRVHSADIVGVDPYTDIAVLRVPVEEGVFPLRRASRQPIYVGDRVYTFGSPFNIKFSMAEGIISGLGRSEAASFVGMLQGYTNFIQTDAAMNPGNSGGPLVNVNGRVVGMSAAIANNVSSSEGPQQGQSAGIGFAIPIDTIDAVVAQLIDDEVIIRGYLGIQLNDARWSRRGDGYNGDGVRVTRVVPDQPAQRAGLEPDDIIMSVDGLDVPNSAVLRSTVSVREPGSTLIAEVWRDGETLQIPVRIGGAFMAGRGSLTYIPGSAGMSKQEIREWVNRNN